MTENTNSSADSASLDLTPGDRKLVLEDLFIFDMFLLRPIADTDPGLPVVMTIDDLEDLLVYLGAASHREICEPLLPKINALTQKINQVLNAHSGNRRREETPSTSEPNFPVTLSQAQRRAIAECVAELAEQLKLDEPHARVIQLTLAELRQIKRKARRAVVSVSRGMKRNSLQRVIEITCEVLDKFQPGSIEHISPTGRIYQLRISIMGITPEIWRRIQIKDCTLDRLHDHIQLAFGWSNCHLHQFMINGKKYGNPWLIDDGFEEMEFEDSTAVKLSDTIPRDGTRFRFAYEYDFGDSWGHEILFEGCLRVEKGKRYPMCLEGERNCPPEDVGGIPGYAEYIKAVTHPIHPRHAEFLSWRGPFNPEAFDAVRATKAMRRGMPKPQYEE